ncbi:MAG: hydrogenase maturation nickel metallochaperone HypA [Bacteroidales bacterium]
MHELSVAQNIIEIVEEHAKKLHALAVSEVELDIGMVSGVIPENLEFAMDVAIKNTLLEGAKIKINVILAKAKCLNCLKDFEMDDIYTMCLHCGSLQYEIIQGKELKVKSIKIEDKS